MNNNKTKRILSYCEKHYPQYYDNGWHYYIECVDGIDYIVQFNNYDSAKDWFINNKYFINKTKEHFKKGYVRATMID